MDRTVFTFDVPILVLGLIFLIWLRITKRNDEFQVGCQFVGTFWAQYSFGVSWSLSRMVPILSATFTGRNRVKELSLFFPFAVYAIIGTLIASFSWDIPAGVSRAYGEYRVWIQVVNLLTLILSARAFANALLSPRASRLLWEILTSAVIIHGLFSLYQFVGWYLDWPLIGISRSHGETLMEGVGDIAAFEAGWGIDVVRPAGLAGEPKTAAALFGTYFLSLFFTGFPPDTGPAWKWLGRLATGLGIIGFFLALSTSAFIGSIVAFVMLAILLRRNFDIERTVYLFSIVVLLLLAWCAFEISGEGGFLDLLQLRTIERLKGDMDPPVEACLHALGTNPIVLLFGTGAGGSSFLIMKHLGLVYDYAFAPNIGLVLLLAEHGLVGTLLLLAPCGFVIFRFLEIRLHRNSDTWKLHYLMGVGVSSLCIILAGSGMAMGPVLAIGCIAACSDFLGRNRPTQPG